MAGIHGMALDYLSDFSQIDAAPYVVLALQGLRGIVRRLTLKSQAKPPCS
jgi:molybdopterin/thiamine biosynthesis adenylyltransferase